MLNNNLMHKEKGIKMTKNRHKINYMILISILGFTLLTFGKKEIGSEQNQLKLVLTGTASYCEKLERSIFHFFCLEKIVETREQSIRYPKRRQGLKNFLENNIDRQGTTGTSTSVSNKMNRIYSTIYKNRVKGNYLPILVKKRNTHVYDYQIIKEKKGIREQRKIIKVNKKKPLKDHNLPDTILYSFENAITPVYFFSRQNQNKYIYKIIGKKKLLGRRAYLITVASKMGSGNSRKIAKAWIDTIDFSIMKFDVFPGAIKGYEKLLEIHNKKISKLKVKDTHIFGYLYKGIRYPTRTEISLSYFTEPGSVIKKSGSGKVRQGGLILTKIKTLISYKKYAFFDVSVTDPEFRDIKSN
ncbi:MAG: hypothetical protein ABFR75_05795 [Acidobacteriota bacterium]